MLKLNADCDVRSDQKITPSHSASGLERFTKYDYTKNILRYQHLYIPRNVYFSNDSKSDEIASLEVISKLARDTLASITADLKQHYFASDLGINARDELISPNETSRFKPWSCPSVEKDDSEASVVEKAGGRFRTVLLTPRARSSLVKATGVRAKSLWDVRSALMRGIFENYQSLGEKAQLSSDGTLVFAALEWIDQNRGCMFSSLLQSMEDHVFFRIAFLDPYISSLKSLNERTKPEGNMNDMKAMDSLFYKFLKLVDGCYFSPIMNPIYPCSFVERLGRGMVRNGQARLIELTLSGLNGKLKGLIDQGGDISELYRAVWHSMTLFHFFTGERFRSERLEILILKYVDENGVNMDVVRGVEVATDGYDIAYEAFKRIPLDHYQFKDVVDKVFRRTPKGFE